MRWQPWLMLYTGFLSTKQGLAAALHSGDPEFATLPDYFRSRLEPALSVLLNAAADAGEVRADVAPYDLLRAGISLWLPGTMEQRIPNAWSCYGISTRARASTIPKAVCPFPTPNGLDGHRPRVLTRCAGGVGAAGSVSSLRPLSG